MESARALAPRRAPSPCSPSAATGHRHCRCQGLTSGQHPPGSRSKDPHFHLWPWKTPTGLVDRGGVENADGMANAFACLSILMAARGRAASTLRVEGTRAMGSRSGRQRGGLTCPQQLAPPSVTWCPWGGDLCRHLAFCSSQPLDWDLTAVSGSGRTAPAFVATHVLQPLLLFVRVGTTALSLHVPPSPSCCPCFCPSFPSDPRLSLSIPISPFRPQA